MKGYTFKPGAARCGDFNILSDEQSSQVLAMQKELYEAEGIIRQKDVFLESSVFPGVISGLCTGNSTLYVLEDSETGEVVGSVVIDFLERENGRCCSIRCFVIAAAHRRLGLGKIMMDGIRKLCQDEGAVEIALLVDDRNKGAPEFYDALGFNTTVILRTVPV